MSTREELAAEYERRLRAVDGDDDNACIALLATLFAELASQRQPEVARPAPAPDAVTVTTELDRVAGYAFDATAQEMFPLAHGAYCFKSDARRAAAADQRTAVERATRELRTKLDAALEAEVAEAWHAAEIAGIDRDANTTAARDLAELRELYEASDHRIEGSAACPHDCVECSRVRSLLGLDGKGVV